jgi:hypothetical protein
MLHMPMLRVFFDSGKTEVAPEFADKAKALVAYLQGNPDAKAVISGFNDPTGDPAKNAELSKHRAEAVQTALVAAGVPIERTALENRPTPRTRGQQCGLTPCGCGAAQIDRLCRTCDGGGPAARGAAHPGVEGAPRGRPCQPGRLSWGHD